MSDDAQVPVVSVVIANHNGSAALRRTIPTVLGQQGVTLADVTLVDNQSTDDSVAMVKENFPTVRTLQTGDNRGPNVARNLGIRHAAAELVLVMDNDVALAPDYARRMADMLTEDAAAGSAGGKVVLYDEPYVVQYNGADIHFAGEVRLRSPWATGRAKAVTVPAGAAMFKKSLVEKVGWFDEDFVFGWEDGDLAFRLSLAGHCSLVDSEALAYHQGGKRSSRWVFYQVRNRWWFARKNFHKRTFVLCLPAIMFLQLCAAMLFLFKGQGGAALRGNLEGLLNRDIRRKHLEVQKLRRVPDRDLLCGDRLTVFSGVVETLPGRIIAGAVSGLFRLYWLIIRPLLKR